MDVNLSGQTPQEPTPPRYTALGLLIEIIRKHPKADKDNHIADFVRRIQSVGYEEYLDAALRQIAAMSYSTAYTAAIPPRPPSRQELAKITNARKIASVERSIAAKAAAQATIAKVAWLVTFETLAPNGKPIGDCTFAEYGQFKGAFARLEQLGQPNQRGRDVLSLEQFQAAWSAWEK